MTSSRGLELSSSAELKHLLSNAASNDALSEDIRGEAQRLSEEKHVTWRQLRPVYNAVRDLRSADNADAAQALKTSKLVIPAVPEKVKSPELKARLEKLQRQADERKYQAMVADITTEEKAADAAVESALGSYKDQLGYGFHIIVVMGVFYLIGHLAASTISHKLSVKAAGGLTGLILAMLMESVLLIIRTSGAYQRRRKKKSAYLSNRPAGPVQSIREEHLDEDGLERSAMKSFEAKKLE